MSGVAAPCCGLPAAPGGSGGKRRQRLCVNAAASTFGQVPLLVVVIDQAGGQARTQRRPVEAEQRRPHMRLCRTWAWLVHGHAEKQRAQSKAVAMLAAAPRPRPARQHGGSSRYSDASASRASTASPSVRQGEARNATATRSWTHRNRRRNTRPARPQHHVQQAVPDRRRRRTATDAAPIPAGSAPAAPTRDRGQQQDHAQPDRGIRQHALPAQVRPERHADRPAVQPPDAERVCEQCEGCGKDPRRSTLRHRRLSWRGLRPARSPCPALRRSPCLPCQQHPVPAQQAVFGRPGHDHFGMGQSGLAHRSQHVPAEMLEAQHRPPTGSPWYSGSSVMDHFAPAATAKPSTTVSGPSVNGKWQAGVRRHAARGRTRARQPDNPARARARRSIRDGMQRVIGHVEPGHVLEFDPGHVRPGSPGRRPVQRGDRRRVRIRFRARADNAPAAMRRQAFPCSVM